MEIRMLRYFMETAREANMSRAAEHLHISQPTMSKQLKELEGELGTKLFHRSNYSIRLTEAGMLFRERAEDILQLVDKTLAEFQFLDDLNSGDIFVGSAESDSIRYFAEIVKDLQNHYPKIRCNMYSGNMEDVCERLDRGLLDFAIVMSFVDRQKYNYFAFPASDTWGVVMLHNAPLAKKDVIPMSDLFGLPLICSRQWIKQDFSQWFQEKSDNINIVATYNLSYNAFVMVRAGMGYAICYDKLADTRDGSDLVFRPLAGVSQSDMYVIWRKQQTFPPVAKLLLKELRERFQ